MILRKKTIVNSVRYIAQSEQTQEGDFKPTTIKSNSIPRKQNKNISQINKKFFKDTIRGERFGILK